MQQKNYNKRNYPVDKNGNIDEWAAVIKRQTDAAEKYN